MKKALLIILCFVSISLIGQKNDIEINLDAPASVVAGEEFEVTITFNKGNLKDYSRFSQDLPAGITARNIESPNADFTFSEQRVRIIWLKLPPEEVITVRYALTAHERVSGSITLAGSFAFVEQGERAYINLTEPKSVEIQPNPNIASDQVVDIKDFNTLTESPNQISEEEFMASATDRVIFRQKPVLENDGSVTVVLLVNNPKGSNYLKLEETIPEGYTMEEVDNHGGIASKSGSMIRYVWMRPPGEEVFTIEYRLVPLFGVEQGELKIDGNLTYSQGSESIVVDVEEVEINLLAMNKGQQSTFLDSGDIPEGLAELAPKKQTRKAVQAEVKKAEPVAEKKVESKTIRKPARKPVQVSYSRDGQNSFIDIPQLEDGSGTYFRVQVAALKRPYFAGVFFADYSLLEGVKVEVINGWNKFTVGAYSSYEEAVSTKKKIASETPIKEAFIIGYKDGKRVPVSTIR